MIPALLAVLASFRSRFRSRAALQAEVFTLRHQLLVLERQRTGMRVPLRTSDRLLWVWLSRIWPEWRQALVLVQPETVLRWHRQGFRLYWRWKSRPKRPGRYVIRDRDRIYGTDFRRRVEGLGLQEVTTAPRSPWQNCYAERFIGSLRRECLDPVIVLHQRHLGRILSTYARYYNRTRTHLALEKDAPERRAVHDRDLGEVIAFPEVGGLHHRYERRAA